MSPALIITLALSIVGCNSSSSCDTCIKLSSNQAIGSFNEDGLNVDSIPLAIEFFTVYELIRKYDGKHYDSLPEWLKNDNRQTIYRTVDQNGFYSGVIKPELIDRGIIFAKGSISDSTLSFRTLDSVYTIKLSHFNQNDGVIFFQPGKKPMIWSEKFVSKVCGHTQLISSYFN